MGFRGWLAVVSRPKAVEKEQRRVICPPDEIVAMKGKRWPVTATDRVEAIKKAKKARWWPLCLTPSSPFFEHGRWWFVVDVDPQEFIR